MSSATAGESARELEGAPALYPNRGYAWFALALLLFVYTCSFIDRQLLSILVQPIRADLGLSDTEISLLQGFAFALFFATFGVPLGAVADRSNRRNLIMAGLVTWCLATAACGLSHSFFTLFIARVIVGAAEACLSPAAYSLISDLFRPENRARAIAIYASGAYFGAGMGFLAGGQVVVLAENAIRTFDIATLSSWQLSFIVAGLSGLVLPPVLLLLREPSRKGRLSTSGKPPRTKDGLRFLLDRRKFYVPFLATLCVTSIINYNLFSWTPTLLQRQFGFSLPASGAIFGVILLTGGLAGMALAGILIDRVRTDRREALALHICAIATALVLPSILMATLSDNSDLAIAGFAGAIFFIALIVPLGPFVVQAISPNEYRGFAASIYILVLNIIGLGFGPTMSAMIAEAFGLTLGHALSWLAIALLPPSAALFLLAARRVKDVESYL